MLKRTPGKWIWAFSKDPDTRGKPAIFVEGADGEPLTPTIGDLELMAHAPEMHEMLYKVEEELARAIAYRNLTQGIYDVSEQVSRLLGDINVKRQKEKRR